MIFARAAQVFLAFSWVALLMLMSSCGAKKNRIPPRPIARIGYSQEGLASWYGEPYHGRRAANGEIYNMQAMTAAHPSLPFETWVRVRNLDNRRQTEVRITDRGPFVKGRIVDLSLAAARQIDLERAGVAKVKLTVIDAPDAFTRGRKFTVQVSTLRDAQRANQLAAKLRQNYSRVTVRRRAANAQAGNPEMWRVLVGEEKQVRDAQQLLLQLLPTYTNAFVIPFDVD